MNKLCYLFIGLMLVPPLPSFAESIRISGSTSAQSAISILTDSFYKQHGVQLVMRPIGSGKGLKSVVEGKSELGALSRALTSEEREQFKGLKQITLAHDSLAILINAKNPVNNLSVTELSDIYTGNIDQWSEISTAENNDTASNSLISVFSKASSHGTFNVFKQNLLLESFDKNNAIYFRKYGEEYSPKGAKTYRRVNGAVASVCRNKNGIAFDSYASIKNSKLKNSCLNKVKVIDINQLSPTDQSYFFVRPINIIYNPNNMSDETQLFLKFIRQKEIQEELKKNHYISFLEQENIPES